MARYQIPPNVRPGFSVILTSTPSKIDSLISSLKAVPKGILPNKLVDYLVEKKVYDTDNAMQVVAVLASLYTLKENESKRSLEDIIQNIFAAVKELKIKNITVSEKKFKEIFHQLFTIKQLSTTFKVVGLAMEYDKIFVDARIITDIRPVFSEDLKTKSDVAAIIHTLKIEYHHGKLPHEEIYLALDNNDLKKIKEQASRAENKEKSIRDNFKNMLFITSE